MARSEDGKKSPRSPPIFYPISQRLREERCSLLHFRHTEQDGALLGLLLLMMIVAHDFNDFMTALLFDASTVLKVFEDQMFLAWTPIDHEAYDPATIRHDMIPRPNLSAHHLFPLTA